MQSGLKFFRHYLSCEHTLTQCVCIDSVVTAEGSRKVQSATCEYYPSNDFCLQDYLCACTVMCSLSTAEPGASTVEAPSYNGIQWNMGLVFFFVFFVVLYDKNPTEIGGIQICSMSPQISQIHTMGLIHVLACVVFSTLNTCGKCVNALQTLFFWGGGVYTTQIWCLHRKTTGHFFSFFFYRERNSVLIKPKGYGVTQFRTCTEL